MEDRESDYYNVTVNFVVKRLPNYDAEEKHKTYLRSHGLRDTSEKSKVIDKTEKAALQLHEKEDDLQIDNKEFIQLGESHKVHKHRKRADKFNKVDFNLGEMESIDAVSGNSTH